MKQQKDQPARRSDAGKLRYDLIPTAPLAAIAEVFTEGAAEYGDRNWEAGMDWSRAYASLQRHANAFWAGEDADPKSGLHHMAHVAVNAMFLIEYFTTHPELDNRVKRKVTNAKSRPTRHP